MSVNTITMKQSATASAVPTAGQLELGELAINTTDGKLYLKKGDNTIVQVGAGGGGTADAGTLTGATLASNVLASSLTSVGTLANLASNAYIISSSGIQAKTASYTLVTADNGKVITMNVATANTLTVPASLAVGFNCTIIQIGAGATTISASGTTLNSVSAFLKISAQHGSASIISYSSNVYNVAGSLSA